MKVVTEREERGKRTVRYRQMCRFTPQMASRGLGQSTAKSQELDPGLARGWQEPRHCLLLSQVHLQETGPHVEQPVLKLMPSWDVGDTGGVSASCATAVSLFFDP